MLSACIPVYNFDVTQLVHDLNDQCGTLGIDFEIICLDDGSKDEYKSINKEIASLEKVHYSELEQNIGRSKIRNTLAEMARFDYLLFLDCDSAILDEKFIEKYVQAMKPGAIVYGGRCYTAKAPQNEKTHFRWWYGVERETISVAKRIKQPYRSFMTNNFLIPKDIFSAIRLDESLKGYGHEDTLFGIELKKRKIDIIHIENELCHVGLETFEEYLKKTKEGIRNLVLLINENRIDDDVRLYRFYKRLKAFGLDGKIGNYFHNNESEILLKLRDNQPNLKWFDLYKLGYLISLMRS